MGVTDQLVVGVDGGNSKTEVALATSAGEVLAVVRGPGSSPDKLGDEQAARVIDHLVRDVTAKAHVVDTQVAAVSAFVAGLDLPDDAPRFRDVLARAWPDARVWVENDTVAALHAGTGGGPGVAVVCGAGINAVGLGPHGQRASFLSLGARSGDWGGGLGLGRAVLWHAIRAEDGRGPRTRLTELTLGHFGLGSVAEVAVGLQAGQLAEVQLSDLVEVLFRADDEGDPVAVSLVVRLAEEVASMARVTLDRTALRGAAATVVLAGGVLTGGRRRLDTLVDDALQRVDPTSRPLRLHAPPVTGALAHALPGGLPDAERSRMSRLWHDIRRVPATEGGVM